MTLWFRHPNADLLAGFASRSLATDEQRAVGQHLETCVRCRETVVALRAVEDLASDAQPTDAVLERIITSRSAGVRMVLPMGDVSVATTRRPGALVAGLATAAALLALFLIRGSNNASAGERTGYLRLDPPRPVPGAMIHVSYTPSAALQGFDSLVLRARFRRRSDEGYNRGPMHTRAGILHRKSTGVFDGEFRLPDSVVFAVFAVETPSGDVVDDNDERLWDLVTADETRRPLFEALVQKERDLMGRNWEEGLKTVRTLTALYPDEPEAWSLLSNFERWVLGDRIADSLMVGHRRRFAVFHRALAEQHALPVATISGMLSYAIAIDDTVASRHWRTRLEREFPDDPDVLFSRENRLSRDHFEYNERDHTKRERDPGAYFRALEPLWAKLAKLEPSGDSTLRLLADIRLLAQNAAVNAWAVHDTAALRVWIPRLRSAQRRTSDPSAFWGTELLQYPTLRRMGMEWLRDDARLLAEAPDAYRPLTATTAEQRVANRAAAQPILAELANALIQDGDTTAGLDTLRLAASYGWSPAVFLRIAQTWTALGDTVQALQGYARVAADPAASPAFGDSIRAATAPQLPSARWDSWVRDARGEMRAAVLRGAAPRSLTGPTRLLSSTGETHRLSDLAQGHVTVVMFWSPACFFSVHDLGAVQKIARQFSGAGARVVAIVDRPWSDEVRRLLKEQHAEDLPVFYDYRSDTKRAFVTFAWPDYYVLDAAGKVVFSHSRLEAIPRQVAALLP